MSSPATSTRRRLATIGAVIALAATTAACGSDDPRPELPEGGTGNPGNDAIIASESHDPILLEGGNAQMLVAVDCDPPTGESPLVTVVGEGIAAGTYIGVFEPATGVELVFDTPGEVQSVGTAEMTLDAEDYTVTFADIDGAVFDVRGCPS
jgi:hypothetical protein